MSSVTSVWLRILQCCSHFYLNAYNCNFTQFSKHYYLNKEYSTKEEYSQYSLNIIKCVTHDANKVTL